MVRDDFDKTYHHIGGAVTGESTDVARSTTADARMRRRPDQVLTSETWNKLTDIVSGNMV